MPDRTYRWGFIGAGWMAQAQASDLQLLDSCQVAGVVSATQASAQAFARQFSARAYPSLDAMLADPAIDIVHVTTPNQLHHPHAKLALQAGKAVLCEKPFTLNAAEAADLAATARAEGVFLMEAMWVRFLPLVVRLRKLLAGGVIGQVRSLQASFLLEMNFVPHSRIFDLALGGGALLDLGIYPISYASMLFGPAPVEIDSRAQLGRTGVDEHFEATLHYSDGAVAQVSAAVDNLKEEAILIEGERGRIRVERDGRGWSQHRLQIIGPSGNAIEEIELAYLGQGYAHQALELIQRLDAGELESPVLPLEESVAIMRILDALRAQWGLEFPGE